MMETDFPNQCRYRENLVNPLVVILILYYFIIKHEHGIPDSEFIMITTLCLNDIDYAGTKHAIWGLQIQFLTKLLVQNINGLISANQICLYHHYRILLYDRLSFGAHFFQIYKDQFTTNTGHSMTNPGHVLFTSVMKPGNI